MELDAGFELDAVGGDLVDDACLDRAVAGAEGGVEVAIRAHADALFEGVVAGLEVGIVGYRRWKLFHGGAAEHLLGQVGEVEAELDEEEGHYDPFPADELVGEICWAGLADKDFQAIGSGLRHHIARAALEHCYVLCFLCECWEHGDGCCTGANDNHVLVAVVQVLGPELWVHHSPAEILDARDGGCEWFVIVVVSRAEEHETGGEGLGFAVGVDIQ